MAEPEVAEALPTEEENNPLEDAMQKIANLRLQAQKAREETEKRFAEFKLEAETDLSKGTKYDNLENKLPCSILLQQRTHKILQWF